MSRDRRPAGFASFVRANHPDVGGDPEEFARGLAELRRRARPVDPSGRADRDPRWDAPVVVVRRPS
ncbi:hypothetical protein [Saccharothrix australiensis]|uniref:Uncharacterized protein n=1 Tax=Saccharothrix australiensis TaxID=2072 RepID=A0A495W0U5_9PSEU|nr:hypothetical protein [Saccharothrix australiensis]RKT53498.1 hypothetical protein C8E97_2063 [Saccharothrix australiensis]